MFSHFFFLPITITFGAAAESYLVDRDGSTTFTFFRFCNKIFLVASFVFFFAYSHSVVILVGTFYFCLRQSENIKKYTIVHKSGKFVAASLLI